MTRSVADINAEIRGLVDRLGALRAERRIAQRRAAGIKPHRGVAYRTWTAEAMAPVKADWIAKVPFAEMLRRHGLTRGQLMGLRLRQHWPARRDSYPEMSARQYFRVQKLVPRLGREQALARVLTPTRSTP
jgi:hypothetical protein